MRNKSARRYIRAGCWNLEDSKYEPYSWKTNWSLREYHQLGLYLKVDD